MQNWLMIFIWIRPFLFFSTDKVLVKVHPEGKFVVDIDEKNVDMKDVTPNLRVALKNDSYVLHKILPNKVDPLVSLMMVEKVIAECWMFRECL